MAANRRRLVHRLQAEDPLDLSALERQVLSMGMHRSVIGLICGLEMSLFR
jgi:hypothetical protein